MKKRYFLPMKAPQFVGYSRPTAANAIVLANAGENTRVLLCSKHINCHYQPVFLKQKFSISIFDYWCMRQDFLRRQSIRFLKETYLKENTNLILVIKKCLLFNAYVFGDCNRKYIEQDYEGDQQIFSFVITGFDDISHEFTIYGLTYLWDEYKCFKVDYQKFINALFDTPKESIQLELWHCNKEASISLDLPCIIGELGNYINSANSKKEYIGEKVYGLKAIFELSRHFAETAKKGEDLCKVYFDQFAVHKYFMKDRVEYLAESGIINPKWLVEAETAEKLGQSVQKLGATYNLTRESALVDQMCEQINTTIEMERSYLPKMLEELEHYNAPVQK